MIPREQVLTRMHFFFFAAYVTKFDPQGCSYLVACAIILLNELASSLAASTKSSCNSYHKIRFLSNTR